MKLAVLFSGGKDSTYALFKAAQEHEIACLITLKSKNKESYMFHTPNIDITSIQAQKMNLPLITVETSGEKEKELIDLSEAVGIAKKQYNIEGVVTGAIESVYQGSRIQKICSKLGLWCFNPLWKIDQLALLNELLEHKFKVIIAGVFAYPFEKKWLGRELDQDAMDELKKMKEKYQINPSGEGGEFESLVLDCPLFESEISIKKSRTEYDNYSGLYIVEEIT